MVRHGPINHLPREARVYHRNTLRFNGKRHKAPCASAERIRAELRAPTLAANRSACSHTCEHTRRSADRHLLVGIGDTCTRVRARREMESMEGSCERGRDGPPDQRQRVGRGVSSRCVYAGGYRRKRARVYREWGHVRVRVRELLAWKSHGLVRDETRVCVRVSIRARPKDAKVYW